MVIPTITGKAIQSESAKIEPLRPNVSITGTGNEKKGRRGTGNATPSRVIAWQYASNNTDEGGLILSGRGHETVRCTQGRR